MSREMAKQYIERFYYITIYACSPLDEAEGVYEYAVERRCVYMCIAWGVTVKMEFRGLRSTGRCADGRQDYRRPRMILVEIGDSDKIPAPFQVASRALPWSAR